MKKLLILFMFVVLCNITYGSELFGYSEIPNKFIDVPLCVGDVNIKVYPTDINGTYNISDCNQTNITNSWTCSCKKEYYIQIPNGTRNTFSFTVEYYIKPLVNNLLTDFNARRIIQINNLIITEISIEQYKKEQEEIRQQGNRILKFIAIFVVLFFVLLILIALYFFYVKPKFRRKLNIDEDDTLTISMILKSIFNRDDIKRKETKIINSNINAEEEARKILEKINR
jgi:hypothetical protein